MSEPEDNLQENRGQALNRAFDPELIRRFIENQAQEVEVRREENEIKKRELEYSYDHAKRLLDAQIVDRDRERQHEQRNNSRGAFLLCFFFVTLLAAILYALFLNKDVLVMELAKYIGFLLAGGLTGYSIKAIKDKKDDGK
jgi:hypothetical protein